MRCTYGMREHLVLPAVVLRRFHGPGIKEAQRCCQERRDTAGQEWPSPTSSWGLIRGKTAAGGRPRPLGVPPLPGEGPGEGASSALRGRERLVIAKDQNGVDAWSQLQQDWLSTRTFKMEVDGTVRDLAYGEIISYYSDPDRKKRRDANTIVYGTGKDEILWASALRSICSDHLHMCNNKYEKPIVSLLDNDVEEAAIWALMNVVRKNVMTYRRYLKLKGQAPRPGEGSATGTSPPPA